MKLNSHIIAWHLMKNYEIVHNNRFLTPTLCSFSVYCNEELRTDTIYIITASELQALKEYGRFFSFVCIDDASFADIDSYDVILIRGTYNPFQLINHLSEIFKLYHDWESMLNSYHSVPDLTTILKKSQHVLPGKMFISDYYSRYVAFTSDFAGIYEQILKNSCKQIPHFIIHEVLTDSNYDSIRNKRDPFEYMIHTGSATRQNALCYNLFRPSESTFYGRLILILDAAVYTQRHYYLIEQLGACLNRIFMRRPLNPILDDHHNNLRLTIQKLLDNRNNKYSLNQSILEMLNWNETDSYYLLKFSNSSFEYNQELHVLSCEYLESCHPDSCALVYQNSVLLIVNGSRNHLQIRDVLTDNMKNFARENLYKIGISNCFDDFRNIHSAYVEASAAMDIGHLKNNAENYYYFKDYTLEYMVARASVNTVTEHLCHPEILHLIKYDSEHQTNYNQALYTYLKCRYNASQSAQKLFIHRTTFLKYLDKIREMTNLDLENFDTRVHLTFSYWLLNRNS